ncbi:hypothetical protein OA77_24140, partial [Pseudomonas coronafaciens]
MKRLEIVLIGHSSTLSELHAELLNHGHGVRHLPDRYALSGLSISDASILINDGSLTPDETPQSDDRPVQLSLRVGFSRPREHAQPRLELLCWEGPADARRLIACECLPVEPSGNGRMLRDEAVARMVDMAALQVSRFSRDENYFNTLPTAQLASYARQEG